MAKKTLAERLFPKGYTTTMIPELHDPELLEMKIKSLGEDHPEVQRLLEAKELLPPYVEPAKDHNPGKMDRAARRRLKRSGEKSKEVADPFAQFYGDQEQ